MSKLSLSVILIGILVLASVAARLWGAKELTAEQAALRTEVIHRIRAWWIMCIVFLSAWWCGFFATVLLFLIISALALREYLTLVETKRADHRALIWSFLIITPLQYYLIAIDWYGLFSIFVPIYGFLFVMTKMAMSGDTDRYLERVAKVHWGLMTCVFLISHAPAILVLPVIGFEGSQYLLFFYLIVLTELSDVFQFCAGKAFGRTKIAPAVSPNKTVEGLVGGMILTALCAAAFDALTPFPLWLDACGGALLCLMGFFGGLCLSAVKRDRGCKDFGTLIRGHGGMLDRVDSLCFTAPLFFHFTRYFYTL